MWYDHHCDSKFSLNSMIVELSSHFFTEDSLNVHHFLGQNRRHLDRLYLCPWWSQSPKWLRMAGLWDAPRLASGPGVVTGNEGRSPGPQSCLDQHGPWPNIWKGWPLYVHGFGSYSVCIYIYIYIISISIYVYIYIYIFPFFYVKSCN